MQSNFKKGDRGGRMISTATAGIENLTTNIAQEIHVRASLEVTFDALLAQLGPENDTPEGKRMAMKIEAWPGGRWFRDLGDDNGHFWGHVQAIKRPTLVEITGPLFMSYPVVSNLQYRLSEEDGGTLIKFHHLAFGAIPDDHKQGMGKGWTHMHARLKERAEAKGKK
jgi:uncharacterized protein YndB with AHSA1/START domain